jgi:hypothetical protein
MPSRRPPAGVHVIPEAAARGFRNSGPQGPDLAGRKTGNSRNGHSKKTVLTEEGEIRGLFPWRLSKAGPGRFVRVATGRHPKPFT